MVRLEAPSIPEFQECVCGLGGQQREENSPVGNPESYPLYNSKSEIFVWACHCRLGVWLLNYWL